MKPQRHLARAVRRKFLAVEQIIPALRHRRNELAVVIAERPWPSRPAMAPTPAVACHLLLQLLAGKSVWRCASACLTVRGRSGFSSVFSGDISCFATFVPPASSIGFGCSGCVSFFGCGCGAGGVGLALGVRGTSLVLARRSACRSTSAGSNPWPHPCRPRGNSCWNNISCPSARPAKPGPDPRREKCSARLLARPAAIFFARAACAPASAAAATARLFCRVHNRPTPENATPARSQAPTSTVSFQNG